MRGITGRKGPGYQASLAEQERAHISDGVLLAILPTFQIQLSSTATHLPVERKSAVRAVEYQKFCLKLSYCAVSSYYVIDFGYTHTHSKPTIQ